MSEEGLVLTGPLESAADRNLIAALRFFGVPHRVLPFDRFSSEVEAGISESTTLRVFCSSDVLGLLTSQREESPIAGFSKRVHSFFAYLGEDLSGIRSLLAKITGATQFSLTPIERPLTWIVTDSETDFCGPMSGLSIDSIKSVGAFSFSGAIPSELQLIFSSRTETAFIRGWYGAAPAFVTLSEAIVCLDDEITGKDFNIREHLFSALPLVMYVKWAFPKTSWKSPGTGACVVIDDPSLKPQYGFLNYKDLLAAMQEHNFSSNIAFIPWNWRRSNPKVSRLFKEASGRYSLSVHGCDHTRGEFGTKDESALAWRTRTAIDRMDRHESTTGVEYAKVMVFPQGVFCASAMSVLRDNGFLAAVNTEVISSDSDGPRVRVRDVWDVAVMSYSDFPLFTRRYPSSGVENFAFDILLGKPCLVVIHHDSCRGQLADLVAFIDRLNALHHTLEWQGLGDVVLSSYRYRESAPGTVTAEIYGTSARMENTSNGRRTFVVQRRQHDDSTVQDVRMGSESLAWNASNANVNFEFDLEPGQTAIVQLVFKGSNVVPHQAPGTVYFLKTMMRRYLSEFRDCYLAR